MATIQIEDWQLQSDGHGWSLGKPKVTKAGDAYLYDATYYPKLSTALAGLLERAVREDSELQGLQQVVERVEYLRGLIHDAIPRSLKAV